VFINDVTTIHGNKRWHLGSPKKFAKKREKIIIQLWWPKPLLFQSKSNKCTGKVWLSGPSHGNAFAPMSLMCFKNLLSFVPKFDWNQSIQSKPVLTWRKMNVSNIILCFFHFIIRRCYYHIWLNRIIFHITLMCLDSMVSLWSKCYGSKSK